MIVIDDKCLSHFRSLGTCEMCGRRVYPLDPHHAFIKRGVGGGSRLDVREQIAGLCRIPCHHRAEHNTEFNRQIQERIAHREGTTVEAIFDWLWTVLRTPKEKPMPVRPWSVAA